MFAIPGDLSTVTGGYLYERRLLEGLREIGTDTAHLPLGSSFPDPSPDDSAHAVAAMEALDPAHPLIVDGLVFGSLATAGLARARAPIVAMIHHPLAHEAGLSDARREYLIRTERDNLALARAVIVPSPFTARILIDEYGTDPARITVARPGTDRVDDVVPGIVSAGPALIVSVGIQHPRKGHDVLLRALAELSDLPWTAVIVGSAYDPVHAAELATLHTELRLEGRVRFAGIVSVAERDELYRLASVFALATRYEGYGLVFDEALAHGLPVVSCRVGAVPETVRPDAGVLVSPDDPLAFADALRAVLTDDTLRIRMAHAAAEAGSTLPGWLDTARTAQAVLDALA
ncbi:glycosyltransferase family 4 protein [Microbacterium lacus]|uniref:glycosyltransferase family 4 protein n=1 Tax=Microbacterium lacus TaxID=415217 RepID=UPI00384A87FA